MTPFSRPSVRALLGALGLVSGLAAPVSPAAHAAPADASQTLRLERVVLVQRHGVRAPTQPADRLASWTARTWPVWPVAQGELTPHGAGVVALVARGIHAHLVAEGLLSATGCPGDSLVVWADGADQRTRESGRVLADRLAPGCRVAPGFALAEPADRAGHGHKSEKLKDPVFNTTGGACILHKDAAQAQLDAAMGGPQGLVDPPSARAIAAVEAILRPGAAPAGTDPSIATVGDSGIRISGPLAVAADSAEIFLLEYAQGLPLPQVAFGALSDPAQFAGPLAARTRTVAFTRALPYLARRQGALMARMFLDTLAGDSREAAPRILPSTRVLALAGHDDNLSNMAGVFGLDWTLAGQPDATAPATAFSLELWRDGQDGTAYVAARVWYATLAGMRALDPASVGSVAVGFADCPGPIPGACPLPVLRARILDQIPAACGGAGPT